MYLRAMDHFLCQVARAENTQHITDTIQGLGLSPQGPGILHNWMVPGGTVVAMNQTSHLKVKLKMRLKG